MTEVIDLPHFLVLAAVVFSIGAAGIFLNRNNIIVMLMSVELMLLATNINFIAFSSFLHEISGQIFSLIILTIAAAETAIGLAILVVYYKNRRSIFVEDINQLQG